MFFRTWLFAGGPNEMSVLSADGRHGIGIPFGRLYGVRHVETILFEGTATVAEKFNELTGEQ